MCIPFSGFIHRTLGVLRDPDPHLHHHRLMRIPVPTGKTTSSGHASAIAFEAIPRFNKGQTYLTDPTQWLTHVDNPAGGKFPDWIADLLAPSIYPGSSTLLPVDCPIVNSIVRAAADWVPTALSCDDTTVWCRNIPPRSSNSFITTSSTTFSGYSCYGSTPYFDYHNTNGPAVVTQNPTTKNIIRVAYFIGDRLHRTDGPAVIDLENDLIYYYIDDQHVHTAVAGRVIAEGGDLADIPDEGSLHKTIKRLEKTSDTSGFSRHASPADYLADCDLSGVPILSPTYS